MRTNDVLSKREQASNAMLEAFKNNDEGGYVEALNQMFEAVGDDVRAEYEEQIKSLTETKDSNILASRGVRQLTSEEKKFYQKLGEATQAANPKMSLTNIILPDTVIDAVFNDLQTKHPLLNRIEFMPAGGSIRMLLNTNGYQKAAWGQLCADIVKEAMSGFKEIDTGLYKASAFMPVCKAMLDLGYEWLDNYIRQVLYETLANGLEDGIINGTGKDEPIGMIRDVSDDAAVVGGVYPAKAKVAVNDLTPATLGNLLTLIATDPNGHAREVSGLILVVNPADYFSKVMPATTLMAPDGTYRNDVLPYPIEIIQSAAITPGEAVLGMAGKYFAASGMNKNGAIEYSDHYQFLEDARTYVIKLYANGFPMDNNAFLYLDISALRPAVFKFEQTTAPAASTNANLASLKLGSLSLSPAFDAATTAYTAETTNASNVVTAVAANAAAEVAVKLNDTPMTNGTAAVWTSGSNTLAVTVTAEDGTTTKTYTVTVTKQ